MTQAKRPLISVLVPAYNVETYLPRCLDSLIAQTLPGLEIIVVNDGSTDTTGAILDGYACRFPGIIHAVHKENGGISAARNTALAMATGEYIGFMDSDDAAVPEMYESLEATARRLKADLVCCGREDIRGDDGGGAPITFLPAPIEDVVDIREHPEALTSMSPFLWDKLFRHEVIRAHGLRFREDINFCEDFLFVLCYLLRAGRMASIREPLYLYTVSRQGAMTSTYGANILQIPVAFRGILAALSEAGGTEAFLAALLPAFARIYVHRLDAFIHYDDAALQGQIVHAFRVFFDESYPGEWKAAVRAYRARGSLLRRCLNAYRISPPLLWLYIHLPRGLLRRAKAFLCRLGRAPTPA